MPLGPLINVSYVKILTTCYKKKEKCIFVIFFGSQNCLPDEKMALEKALPDGNWARKYHYRTGIGLSNIITGREFGSQKSLPDEN